MRPDILTNNSLDKDEVRLLWPDNHAIEFKPTSHSGLASAYRDALTVTLRMTVVFILACLFSVIRYKWLSVTCMVVLVLTILLWFDSLVVLLRSAVAGSWHLPKVMPSLIYWGFWPFMITVLCCSSALLGITVGNYLWLSSFEQYYQLEELRTYKNVDPTHIPGQQIMDAGIVEFANYVGIDRMHGGCFHTRGHNFCVAPILHGGKIPNDLVDAPSGGSYDYFAVGIDCCNCPNNDFKCGAWNDPLAQGGLRSMDYKSRPQYRMAVEDWSAAYRKTVNHPIFFDWVQDADYAWRKPWYWAFHLLVIALCAPFPLFFILTFPIAYMYKYMVDEQIASPADTPGPPVGFERLWERALPEMREHYLSEQKNSALPQWYHATVNNTIPAPS